MTTTHASALQPTQYSAISLPVFDRKRNLFIAIRKFIQNGQSKYLLVNPGSMATSIKSAGTVVTSGDDMSGLANSAYHQALELSTAPPWLLQNQGLTRAYDPQEGVAYLTIDMCPSSRAFNKQFYLMLIAYAASHPLPITIDISGMWIQHHKEAFNWLKSIADRGELNVTWVNHAYLHRYDPEAPLKENFLLMKGTDFDKEVLDVEKLLIAQGETPSVFIRYPGLVSDARIVKRTRELGLIPLGADAWLAKGQKIKDGSIVLVHANGNEPAGLKLMTRDVLRAHHWHPIAEAAMTRDVSVPTAHAQAQINTPSTVAPHQP